MQRRCQQAALPEAEIGQLPALGQFLGSRQGSALGGKALRQPDAPPEAQRLRLLQKSLCSQLLPQPDKIAVAALCQCGRKVHLAVRHTACAAEDLPVHHHRADAVVLRRKAGFQRSRCQHRLEHRPHRIRLQGPV